MTYLLSKPAEDLLERAGTPAAEVLIVGSGYGAAMAALALSDPQSGIAPETIWVMERGKEYQPGDFPKTAAELPGHVAATGIEVRVGERDALFDLKVGDGVSAIVGSGLGGTSLINGAIAIDPGEDLLAGWPAHPDGRSWNEALRDSRDTVKRMLGVTNPRGQPNTHPRPEKLGKYRALGKVADALAVSASDGDVEGVNAHRLTPLAISFESGPNAVGVHQHACVDCGNCISGCNVGAKNTLAMNAWPLVHSRGVRLFTGGTVLSIERSNGAWTVHAVLTRRAGELSTPGAPSPKFTIRAQKVILAAGTFGSTEILKRSEPELSLSPRLGERFSVNGDMMVLGLRRSERVDSAAITPSTSADCAAPDCGNPVGPLTVSEIRTRVSRDNGHGPYPVSIQDGAVPYPMRRFFGELLATEHLARLFADGRSPEQLTPGNDPMVVDQALLAHSQLITAMGRESSSGTLTLKTLRHAPDRPGEQILEPRWDLSAEDHHDGYYNRLESLFEKVEKHGGFSGGHYLPCPPWRMLPKGLEAVEGFGDIGRHLVTTHPLGGCCMAGDASEGVVDTRGQVFSSATGTETHPGLYVLDGAIIPGPIGVNPLMTIATLSHHLASRMAANQVRNQGVAWNAGLAAIPPGNGFPVPDPIDETVAGALHERLFLDHPAATDTGAVVAFELRRRLGVPKADRLVMDIRTHCSNLYTWLERPDRPLRAEFRFFTTPRKGNTVPDQGLEPLGDGPHAGLVILGGYDAPRTGLASLWRTLQVALHFLFMRGDEIWARLRKPGASGAGFCKFLSVSLNQARVQSAWRFLRYTLDTTIQVDGEPQRIELTGQKTLAYRGREPDPLSALRAMPFSLNGTIPTASQSPCFHLDMIRFTDDLAPFQVSRTPNTPTTVLALASAGLFFLRGILQTHFWSFGAPSYEEYGTRERENEPRTRSPPPVIDHAQRGSRQRARLTEWIDGPGHPGMRLIRYGPEPPTDAPAALLIHGLAHGSRVFWTDTVGTNMVQHLLEQGFQVWLLDHRLSCNLPGDPDPKLSIEDIADTDVPWAVRTVYERINQEAAGPEPRKVRVFAHCIGAAAFQISVLKGHLCVERSSPESMVHCAAIHAVTPWLVASEDNRWRANAISLFRSYFDDLAFDPIPHRDRVLAETLADRFSSSFGWPDEAFRLHRSQERGQHFSRTICNRMTLFYGEEWIHENLADRTHAELHTLVGPAPIEVLKQVYYCIIRGRLTNREGSNEYVLEEPIRNYWRFPTLFLHGDCNKVFDADGSRISARKLASLLGTAGDAPPVFQRIIRGYGHMDILFGKDACKQVFPSITRFLAEQTLPEADRHVEAADRLPEAVRPLPGAVTGPIVSHPDSDGGSVLVWSEVSPLAARRTVVEYYSDGVKLDVSEVPACLEHCRLDARDEADHADEPASSRPADPTALLPAADVRLGRLDVSRLVGPIEVCLRDDGDPASERCPVATLAWHTLPWFRRALGVAGAGRSVSFLVGSCLYPGAPAEQALSGKIFSRMRPFIEGKAGPGAEHLLLVGDQIYADATANLFDPAAPLERFRDRYRRAFGGPERQHARHAHWVLSHVPSYFAVDDHEVSNDWPRDLLRRRNPSGERYPPQKEFDFARGEARSFLIHGAQPEDRLWYDFRSGGYRFFVFDTRTERRLGHRAAVDTLISPAQQAGFARWLDRHAGDNPASPVAIVTGSPLGPIGRSHCRHPALCDQSDALIGFPGFLIWLQQTLRRKGIEEVYWISGDAHLSSLARYDLQVSGNSLTVHHLVASGLFAPLPFANHAWDDFDNHVQLERDVAYGESSEKLRITGAQQLLSDSPAHFVEATLDADGWHVQAHGADGRSSAILSNRSSHRED